MQPVSLEKGEVGSAAGRKARVAVVDDRQARVGVDQGVESLQGAQLVAGDAGPGPLLRRPHNAAVSLGRGPDRRHSRVDGGCALPIGNVDAASLVMESDFLIAESGEEKGPAGHTRGNILPSGAADRKVAKESAAKVRVALEISHPTGDVEAVDSHAVGIALDAEERRRGDDARRSSDDAGVHG